MTAATMASQCRSTYSCIVMVLVDFPPARDRIAHAVGNGPGL